MTELAPDGSTVEPLLRGQRGSMGRFVIPPGFVTQAVRHRSVEELWYVQSGAGYLWLGPDAGRVVRLVAGATVTITAGTPFQFRADLDASLEILGVTMPPWPGDAEAESVTGYWRQANVGAPWHIQWRASE